MVTGATWPPQFGYFSAAYQSSYTAKYKNSASGLGTSVSYRF
jgi:hypothetical protein